MEIVSSADSPEQYVRNACQRVSTSLSSEQAVRVRNAYLYYGSKKAPHVVLDKLNMTVPKGSIYGLLGASGCGKTTLLKCIIGMKQLSSGEVKVFGKVPGTEGSGIPGPLIGYMPQDLLLIVQFTIKEIMHYFGWISGLTTEQIEEKIKLLGSFLQLPSSDKQIVTLSGGQQRRVSLALALIHDPDLLILDEPTCGVDPILRERIWNYMLRLTEKGETTIIITTHYIEEMRQANMVALMRKGVLLAEDSPDQLMRIYATDTLEDVFLKLSTMQSGERRKRSSSGKIKVPDSISEIPISEATAPLVRARSKVPHSIIYKTLIWRNLLWMWRNYQVILFFIVLPVINIVFFNLSIGQDIKGQHFAIYNEELNNSTDACVPPTGCNFELLSCRFLKHFQKRDVILDYYDDVNSTKYAVDKGHATAAFHFPTNYSKTLRERFEGGTFFMRRNFHVEDSEIKVHMDVSNGVLSLLVLQKILLSLEDFIQDINKACDIHIVTVTPPINFLEPVYGSKLPIFTHFAVPGMILTIIFFISSAFAAGAIVMDRTEGSLERTLAAGINSVQILLGHFTISCALTLIQTILLLVFSIYVFEDTCKGDIFTAFILTLLTGFSGSCFGFAVTAATAHLILVSSIIIASMLPLLILTGFIWPLEGIYFILRYFTLILPLTMPTKAMTSIMLRGWTITHQEVYMGFISDFIWIAVFLTIAIVLLRSNVRFGESAK